MKALTILREEHESILRVLSCLDRVREDATTTGELDAHATVEILDFLQRFADGAHQDEEEEVLFPLLLRRARTGTRGSVGVLLVDHREERSELDALRAKIEGAAYGCGVTLDAFLVAAETYALRLRDHAWWEDEHLLPLAETLAHPGDDAWMLAGIADVRRRYFPRGYDVDAAVARIERMLGELAREPLELVASG